MKKVIAILLLLCLCIGLCSCKEDNTCANCDSDRRVWNEYEGKKYCADCYNDIPGVELVCVNCGEKTGSTFDDCCDDCYKKSEERAESIAQDLWG